MIDNFSIKKKKKVTCTPQSKWFRKQNVQTFTAFIGASPGYICS